MQNTPKLIAFYPELSDYLRDYPKARPLPSSSEVLCWPENDLAMPAAAVGAAPRPKRYFVAPPSG